MNVYQMGKHIQWYKLLLMDSLLLHSQPEGNTLFTIFSIPNKNVYLICPRPKPPSIILFINDLHIELSPCSCHSYMPSRFSKLNSKLSFSSPIAWLVSLTEKRCYSTLFNQSLFLTIISTFNDANNTKQVKLLRRCLYHARLPNLS